MNLQTTLALPLALDREQIDVWLAPVQTGPVAVFLDYDGTLTPIVPRPDEAVLSVAMRDTVQRLAARCPVTIVTGRDISVVRAFVDLDVLGYVGNHGLDIVGPPGSHARKELAVEFLSVLDDVESVLRSELNSVQGILVERKRFSVSTHFRLVTPDKVPYVESIVARVASRYPLLRREHGKKVLELRPDIAWDKGSAVAWLLRTLDVVPAAVIYIGDDLTDEHAFEVLADVGTSIVVTEEDRPTAAQWRVRDIGEVQLLLERINAVLLPDGN